MEDLVVAPGPGLPRGLVIPGDLLRERFSHASGPGGQGVNTADSRVQLGLDLADLQALGVAEAQLERALTRLEGRVTGTIVAVDAAEFRSQYRNRKAARERLAGLLRSALLAPPPPRRPTRPTKASKRRRLEAKQRRADVKRGRARPSTDD
ncbi:alternative ribosome rescue aminoacyl-tRNA hydrolase ArfB [Raineyella fluvialis]|uniref:Aminoacyl-tRNA hydrolase n=1 Tax=Raineyella fluvialis TaxID=2662261 RepID=A0A5Q2FK03_9ACTN|nr:alternative ribosome rescue aminoacyl-tRNA hydrolase ArfB [Raineyella fluvialis]QGF24666.1 aminoacyl-tRNA hydrolase [Raineyella fluvialis]